MTHGAVRFLIRALEAAFLVLLLAAALLAWRLSQGALKLDIVAPYIASAFSEIAPGYRFRIDDAEFKWSGFSGAPELTVRDVRVLNEAGAVIAGLPSMRVRLSVEALQRGVAAPEQIRLSNPIVRFVHRADGSLGLGVEGVAAPVPAATPDAAAMMPAAATDTSGNALAVLLISALTQAPGGDNPAGYLDRVEIDATTLVLVDEVSGQRWLVPDATLNFKRAGGDVEIDATLPVIEEGKRWNLTAKGRYTAATETLKVDLDVDGFRPARVAGLAPQLAPLAMIDLRLSGKAAATLQLAGGTARLADLTFDVKGQGGVFHLPGPVTQDYSVKSIAVKGAAGADLDHVTIEQFRVELNRRGEATPVITMNGVAQHLNGAPVVDLNFSMAKLGMPALKQYWPVGIKPNTRSWIDQNLRDGGLYDARLKLHLAGPSMAALDATEARLTAALKGVTVKYMRELPEVVSADGIMTIGPGEVVIDITSGHVPDAVSAKGLAIPTGKVRLYGLGSGNERANIQLKITGGFGDVMRLIDNEPLGYASMMGLDANRASGEANIDLTLDFPLIKDLKLDQLKLGVKATTQGIAIPEVAFGLPLSDGRLALTLDRAGMDVSGSAVLGSIPMAIAWRENFGGGEFRSRYVLDPIVGNAERPKVGLSVMPFIPPYISGPVPAHVIYTVRRDDTRLLEADVDLTPAAMAVPELGWRKEPSKPALAKVAAVFRKDRLESVPSFHVTSGDDLDVSGSVTFDEAGRMRLLSFHPSVVGETKLSGEVGVDEAGGYSIDIKGPTFNSTYFWRELNRDDKRGNATAEAGDKPFVTPMRIRAAFDRMWLTKGADFTDVTLDLDRSYTGIQSIDLSSKVNGSTPFTFKLGTEKGARTFTGSSVDGGSVVRAIGLFGDVAGGNLAINGEFAADGTIKGRAEIKNFNLIQAPLLARLLSVASLTGIVDQLQGKGISFKTLRAPFSYANGTLTVKDGEMYGSSLGLTGEGTYTFASSQMDFEGTLIPAYSLNSILSRIPLLGAVLNGGEKGGGIFAATYTYRGNVATAEPSVNPLAALAPGFLRHIFDIFKSSPREPAKPEGEASDRQAEPADPKAG